MTEVLVIGKKISEMGLVNEITGEEKIPTGVVGDKAVTTGQLLTYLENNGKVQWGRIEGDIANQADLQNQFAQQLVTLQNHVQDQGNPHNVTKEQVGLGLADNTADIDKPVSVAVQEALSLKADQTYVDASLANKTHNSLLGRDADGAHPASAILDASGVTQQEINDVRVVVAGSIAELRSLNTTALNGGRVAYLAGRESEGDGGEGYFLWSQNDYSSEVVADAASGIYIAPNSDETGSSGAWVRQYSKEINLAWFNIPKDVECSKEIQSVINMMVDGVDLFIPNREEPYIIERIDFSNLNNFRVYSDGALFIREPEGTSNRGSGTLLAFVFFTNCNNFSVSGIRLEGNHTKVPNDVSSDDNQQAGFQFSNCNMCEISNCRMSYFRTSMVVADTSEFTIYRCRSQFTRTGFSITGNSSDGIIESCVSKDARMAPGMDDIRINTGGYGFIYSGTGSRILFLDCTSYRSGSSCFRTQGDGPEQVKFESCSSVDASGYGFSIFSPKSAVTNCDVINISDPSIWDGSDYFEIRSSSHGYTIANASHLIIDNCRYFASEFSPVVCNAFNMGPNSSPSDYVTISNCQAYHSLLFAMASGVSAKDLTIINNKAYGFGMTKYDEQYPVALYSTTENARVESNLISGYARGFRLGGDRTYFRGNKLEDISGYGVFCIAPYAAIIGNSFKNCGLNEFNSASIMVQAPYTYITDNTVSGDPLLMQGRRSLWLTANATEAFLGPIHHQGVDVSVRLDAPLTNSALPAFGKSVEAPNSTAQTIEELRSDLNSVLQKLRDANLIDQ